LLWLGAAFGVQYLAFYERALAALGYSPSQIGEEDRRIRLRDELRDAELTVPQYPGAVRLKERAGRHYVETGPVRESCRGALESVLSYYRQSLSDERDSRDGREVKSGWRIRRDAPGSRQLGAESGQVRLLIRGPGPGLASGVDCPPETVYVLSFAAFNPGR